MNKNTLNKGIIAENGNGVGTVTRKMVRDRAFELALINGNAEQGVSKNEWEQAKRELTGGSDADPKEVVLESVPASEQWNPAPGSTGRQIPESPSEDDEDDDGRSRSTQFFENGVAEAEHDQMLQSAKADVSKGT
ncbi:MAG: hypothetical protein H7831_18350 [Magnetococcus sp. WYHC-3]